MLQLIPRLFASLALGALLTFVLPISDPEHGTAAWAATGLARASTVRRRSG